MRYDKLSFLFPLLFVGVASLNVYGAQQWDEAELRKEAQASFNDGNFRDAYDNFQQLCLDERSGRESIVTDLNAALQCLNQLGRQKEMDELLEGTVASHGDDWRLLSAVAKHYLAAPHSGAMISGTYERGGHRGQARIVNSVQRDRTRALQIMVQAMDLISVEDNKQAVSRFYQDLAASILYLRGYDQAWRLQHRTKLDDLPDLDDGYEYPFFYVSSQGAPVDSDGKPVFHALPGSWESATSDGERWRWCLEQAVENDPSTINQIRMQRASFAQHQFGVATMANTTWSSLLGRGGQRQVTDEAESEDAESEDSQRTGTYQLDTLADDETMANLASGIKRFELPDDYDFIKLYRAIVDEPRFGYAETALSNLASTFTNRRQYEKAADQWRESIRIYGDDSRQSKQKQLDQIIKSWGMFEPIATPATRQGASFEFTFRNGDEVEFIAHEIKVDSLLEDIKRYLKSNPQRVDWQKVNVSDLGSRLVIQGEKKYIGSQAATWKESLKPRSHHYDRRVTIDSPLKKPGAYLLTARMKGGNTSRIILWVADSAIAKKQLSGKSFYYVADAETGKPRQRMNVEFFGYRQERVGNTNRYRVVTTNFAERTDQAGGVIPDVRDLKENFQWLIVARGDAGELAYYGFQGVWSGQYYDQQYEQTKVFVVTDRPVYRPGHPLNFKVWVRHAQYDQDDVSQFAGSSVPIEIRNPKGEAIFSTTLTADAYGGVDAKFQLPEDATLGTYTIGVPLGVVGGNTFRVEEYKKPEFEVSIETPGDPVAMGETIKATIEAKYYFGAPVTNAQVEYKVMRSDHRDAWFPADSWDWCFGAGYWWFCYDYPWYPGWASWRGCERPFPWWWQPPQNPPELVAQRTVEIGPDGKVEVEIDTAIVKELRNHTDHKYVITAEVRDQSRRVIIGQGDVLLARQPFKIFSWVDRGFYRVGDTVNASFQAQTLDRKPVQGTGDLVLLKVTYDQERQPVETPVRRWKLDSNAEGIARQAIKASAGGQYRLSYRLSDKAGHEIEGGYLFTIMGDAFDGQAYRFSDIELVPQKRTYQPGETVKMQINTDQAGASVLLFVRPANGIYLKPKLIQLSGKSTVEEIGVATKDMPNFFVEAMTISEGRVHTDVKEIVVPPESRVLNVEVLPSQEQYKPGEPADVKIQITDHTGENFQGTAVIAIYDKSVEYISGGSNTPEIREFFWKWKRQHTPYTQTSLAKYSGNLVPPGELGMSYLGIFGATVADEMFEGDEMLDGESKRLSSSNRSVEGRQLYKSKEGASQRGFAAMSMAPSSGVAGESEESSEFAMDVSGGAARSDQGGGSPSTDRGIQPSVRKNFADTALWVATVTTDQTGVASVSLDMPENLTTWKIRVWGMGHGTKVGSGETEVITRKDLLVRMQSPRFFVQKDEVVLSANIHNYLAHTKNVAVSMELDGDQLVAIDPLTVQTEVESGGESRVDWRVKVVREGEATIRMFAVTDEESDAMEMTFPVYVHGMLKQESWAGTIRPDEQQSEMTFVVPTERQTEQTRFEVRYSPTLAGAMVDALPYLAEFPYGCTEQTLNRWLPSVVTQKVLIDLNLDLDAIRQKQTNLNAQELGDDRQRAAQWQRWDRSPVFDPDELDRMVKEGLKRLAEMQVSDGGWGWFSGYGERSYPHTTAVVVHGLQLARDNDIALVPGMLESGIEWLKRFQSNEVEELKRASDSSKPWKQRADNLDALVYMMLVDEGQDNKEMREFLFRDRISLSVYAKASFGLALHQVGDSEKLALILENIEQFLVQDEENETAYLSLPENNWWWYWYGNETEANAYYLKLLARVEPNGEVAPRLVKYLLNNRKNATYWSSTRDTALCVEAFADYIRASGEAQPDMTLEVWIDDEKKKEVEINGENLFSFDNQFLMVGDELASGEHTLELRRRGRGPLYYNAYLTNFTLEDHITRAGLEVQVDRKYFKLEPVDKTVQAAGNRGQVLDQRVEKYQRVEIDDVDELESGDLVEVELTIQSKNDYEYLLFEDMKPAGFETVEVRSGYNGNEMGAYVEFRDNRVAFFVRRLMRGTHSLSYRMRAEIPGKFSALPTRAWAMYAPELKGNSDEIKLIVNDVQD